MPLTFKTKTPLSTNTQGFLMTLGGTNASANFEDTVGSIPDTSKVGGRVNFQVKVSQHSNGGDILNLVMSNPDPSGTEAQTDDEIYSMLSTTGIEIKTSS